jgi:hypothetical protein
VLVCSDAVAAKAATRGIVVGVARWTGAESEMRLGRSWAYTESAVAGSGQSGAEGRRRRFKNAGSSVSGAADCVSRFRVPPDRRRFSAWVFEIPPAKTAAPVQAGLHEQAVSAVRTCVRKACITLSRTGAHPKERKDGILNLSQLLAQRLAKCARHDSGAGGRRGGGVRAAARRT